MRTIRTRRVIARRVFVVYRREQLYPAYIVTYTKAGADRSAPVAAARW